MAVDEQTWQLGDLRALPEETADSAPAPKPGRGQAAGPLYTVQLEEEERAGGTGGRGGSTGAPGRTMAVELGRLAPSNPKLQVRVREQVTVFQARIYLWAAGMGECMKITSHVMGRCKTLGRRYACV